MEFIWTTLALWIGRAALVLFAFGGVMTAIGLALGMFGKK